MTWSNYKTLTFDGTEGMSAFADEWASKCSNVTKSGTGVQVTSTNLSDGSPHTDYFITSNKNLVEVQEYTIEFMQGALTYGNSMDILGGASYAGTFKCWESDQNAEALLITRGKQIVFFWPGINYFRYATANFQWAAGVANEKTVIFPYLGNSSSPYGCNYPPATATSGTEWRQGHYWGLNYSHPDPFFIQGIGIGATHAYLSGLPGAYLGTITQSDVVLNVVDSPSSADHGGFSAIAGLLMKSGSKFYLRANSDLANTSYCFDMGTVEPTF